MASKAASEARRRSEIMRDEVDERPKETVRVKTISMRWSRTVGGSEISPGLWEDERELMCWEGRKRLLSLLSAPKVPLPPTRRKKRRSAD